MPANRPNPPRPAKRQRKPVECWAVVRHLEVVALYPREITQEWADERWSECRVVRLREVTDSHPHAPQQREVKRLRDAMEHARRYVVNAEEDVRGYGHRNTGAALRAAIDILDAALAPKEKRRG